MVFFLFAGPPRGRHEPRGVPVHTTFLQNITLCNACGKHHFALPAKLIGDQKVSLSLFPCTED
jgi:hypothetical protein